MTSPLHIGGKISGSAARNSNSLANGNTNLFISRQKIHDNSEEYDAKGVP